MSADYFILSLLECEKASEGQKIFGSIHGFHGISAKKACESYGGKFSYITRHPMDRIHSAFIYYAYPLLSASGIDLENRETSDFVKDLFSRKDVADSALTISNSLGEQSTWSYAKSRLKSILPADLLHAATLVSGKLGTNTVDIHSPVDGLTGPAMGNRLVTLFYSLVDSFFMFDNELLVNCDFEQGIKMEEMVVSAEYFKERILDYSVPGIATSDSYLNQILNQGRHGIHRDKPISTTSIWDSLPEVMRNLFLERYHFYKIDELCNQFDYRMPFNP